MRLIDPIVGAATPVLLAAVLSVLAPAPGWAQPVVTPGQWIYLDPPVRNGVECWSGLASADCSTSRWRSPGLPTESSGRILRGVFAPDLPLGAGLDNRAIAWADYEFTVGGTEGFVDVFIGIKHDVTVSMSGSAAYGAAVQVSATLTDISDPNEAYIESVELWNSNRQGDQGVTDISGGGETHYLRGEVRSLNANLARGRSYRVRVAAHAAGSMVVLGDVFAMSEAFVHYLRVQVDEDEFAALTAHNLAMQQALATHDATIKQDVETHDADIKALLQQLKDGQREIIRLLLTPQGRRESTYCTSAGVCSFPGGGG